MTGFLRRDGPQISGNFYDPDLSACKAVDCVDTVNYSRHMMQWQICTLRIAAQRCCQHELRSQATDELNRCTTERGDAARRVVSRNGWDFVGWRGN